MREQRGRDVQANDAEVTGGEGAHGGEGGQTARFTTQGPIPPVVHGVSSEQPSASDRAYGSSSAIAAPAHLRVTASGLNVRSSAGREANNIVGAFHQGDEVDGLERDGDWIRIAYHGAPAYVHGNFVEVAPVKTPHGESAGHSGDVEQRAKHATAIAGTPSPAPAATPVHAPAATPAHAAAPAAASAATPAAQTPPQFASNHAVDPAVVLHTEMAALLAEFDAGRVTQDAALQQFVAFDIAHNAGMPSPTGLALMGDLARDLQAHAAQHVKTAAPAPAAPAPATAAPAPVTAAPAAGAITHALATGEKPPEGSATPNTADHTPAATPYTGTMDSRGGKQLDDAYMAQYHHLAGGETLADHPTQPAEAHELNKIRNDSRKLDPVTLRTLQESLQVKNATGAMNTETLRKLKAKYPAFTVEALLSGTLLGADLKIIEAGGNGFGPHGNGHALRDGSAVAPGERKADAMAKVAGFDNYQALHDSFVDLELFGQPLGQGLPFLAERLKLADTYLRQRIPEAAGVTDRKKLKAIAQQKLQWDGSGNGAYSDHADDIAKASGGKYGAHFHANGLAIDINPSHNPYVFVTTNTTVHGAHGDEKSITGHLYDNLRYAAQIFGGEEITAHTMMEWSDKLSSEELAAKVDMVSHSLTMYIQLCQTGTDEEIELRFRNAGYSAAEAKALVPEAKRFAGGPEGKRYWQDNMSRKNMKGLTTHSMEMVVALRDVAGLAWGGTEMSEGSNGDFMHFDCRNTTVGQKLYAFANHNRGAEPRGATDHDHVQTPRPAAPQGPDHH